MHTEIVRSLRIRHATLFDQPNSLKLELSCKLPSLHDTPPVPSKHLTRCLRNRQQARLASSTAGTVKAFGDAPQTPPFPIFESRFLETLKNLVVTRLLIPFQVLRTV